MKRLLFTKMSGAGNDFIIIDMDLNPHFLPDSSIISVLCNRRFGIGADGLITINSKAGFDFGMEYYNSDGSTGALCGNGARCAIQYGKYSNRLANSKVRFTSSIGNFAGEVLDEGLIKFDLNDPSDIKPEIEIKLKDFDAKLAYINTGTPHAVVEIGDLKKSGEVKNYCSNLSEFPVNELGCEIRNHPILGSQGANVNFIQFDNDEIQIRTYERGVEDETLACGTGSVAAALIANLKYKVKPPINLITKSGKNLIVNFDLTGNGFTNVTLTGPAVVVFTGEITI